ncbi:MAG TPA: hypothetical protein VF660_07935, partial [Actinomycetota bacterium]
RRSRGPDLRPKLVLYTTATGTNPTGRACDPSTPAPTISQVGIHEGIQANSMTVSWETNVDSDSFVLFRQQGTTDWTQVGTPALTKVHHVEVLGLDSSKNYEFVVRSTACNGAGTTDTNGGAAYDFFPPPAPDPGPRTQHASYTFESGDEGWSVATTTSPTPPDSTWVRGAPGASGSGNGWHVAVAGNPANKGYSDEDETTLTSPSVAFAGAQVGIEFQLARDLEEDFDYVHVQYSANGTDWTTAASFTGTNADYPEYEPQDVRFNHPNPGGSLQIRFRFASDELISSPAYLGASVDEVKFASYPNQAATTQTTGNPLTGPVPPPSAGATGLNPALRSGDATPADIAAGTGACSVVASADLTLGKHDSADPSKVNKPLSYFLNVKNKGPDDAMGVKLVDNLPSSAKFVSTSTPQGTCAYNSSKHRVTCNLGDVASGDSLRVIITVKPTKTGRIVNRASLSSTSPADPNLSNNSAGASTQIVR